VKILRAIYFCFQVNEYRFNGVFVWCPLMIGSTLLMYLNENRNAPFTGAFLLKIEIKKSNTALVY